ncbi:MAG: PfkB family carbohydrate kinase, partial [Kineosporiaceae bacterium]
AALVTVGRHGVAGAGPGGTFWLDAPSVPQVNPIGAGDSFAAGLAVGLERRLALREATVLAVATGAASVVTDLAGHVDAAVMNALLTTLLDGAAR